MIKLPALHVGQAVPVGPVTLFPVWADVRPVPGLVTGTKARVDVSELASGPQVDRLSVHNASTKPVLLLEGELLEGGNQTRACVRDVIVAPSARVDLEVVCVEQHRWSPGGPLGRRGRRATATVQKAMRTDGAYPQGSVWDGVRRYKSATGPTGSGSLADHLDRVAAPGRPPVLAGQNGVIVGVAGQPVALELFGSRSALQAHLPGILDAAMLEATLAGPPQLVPARRARRFAQALKSLPWQPAATDIGEAWAARTELVSLRALTAGAGLAQVSAVHA